MNGFGKLGGPPPTITPPSTPPPRVAQNPTKVTQNVNMARIATLQDTGPLLPATVVNNASLTSGSSLIDGGPSQATFSQAAFSLSVLGVDTHGGEQSGLAGLDAFNVSPQDVHAINTETGKAFIKLAEKKQESTLATLKLLQTKADQLSEDKDLKAAVGLALKQQQKAGGADDEEPQALTAEENDALVQQAQAHGIDLTKMAPEEAVMLLFMLMSDGARKDTGEMVQDMDSARLQRAALRAATDLTKNENVRLKAAAKETWTALPSPKDDFDTWITSQPVRPPTVTLDDASGEAKLAEAGSLGGSGTFSDIDASVNALQNKSDSLSELTQTQQLKLQMYMDNMSKADTAATNMQKKLADIISGIIQNMK